MFSLLNRLSPPSDLLTSKLYSDETFYSTLIKDLGNCTSEVIIESPFITSRRLTQLLPTLEKLKARKVRVIINTRNPYEHDEYLKNEAHCALRIYKPKGLCEPSHLAC
jgi:HKD family nuclease